MTSRVVFHFGVIYPLPYRGLRPSSSTSLVMARPRLVVPPPLGPPLPVRGRGWCLPSQVLALGIASGWVTSASWLPMPAISCNLILHRNTAEAELGRWQVEEGESVYTELGHTPERQSQGGHSLRKQEWDTATTLRPYLVSRT